MEDGIQAVNLIGRIREKMILIDANLEDALNMLEGYNKIVNGVTDELQRDTNQQPVQN
jgi:hypothetical protein